MNSKEEAIIKAVEALADDMVQLTQGLVREPSTLGNEASVVNVMEEALVGLGFSPVRVPIAPDRLAEHPGFAQAPWYGDQDQGRHNLVAQIKGETKGEGDEGRSALFNGHLDVVSPDPLDAWDGDPFSPVVRDGWLYGRGAGDMKAGVAAMVHAAKAIEHAGLALKGDLTLEAVIEEECSGNGALACLDAGYDADAVLIPEPFGPTILTSQLGVMWFKIEVKGKPSHVLDTKAGSNAIEKMYPLMSALRELELAMNLEPRPQAYEDIDHPINLNIGIVRGGDWPSTVPAAAEMHCRLSFYPGVAIEAVRRRVIETVRQACSADPWLAVNQPKVSFYGFRSEGHAIDPKAEALATLGGCHETLTGERPAEYHCTCTTDLRAFLIFGHAQGTCYGPVAKNIHAANECVEIASIIHTAKAYALFLARWCGLSE